MSRNATWAAVLAATSVVAACDGCDTTTGPPLGAAKLIVTVDDTTLLSDGQQTANITVKAKDENGDAENAPITVTIPAASGTIIVGGAPQADTTVELEPDNGLAEFQFQCQPDTNGSVVINLDNKKAKPKDVTITCLQQNVENKAKLTLRVANARVVGGSNVDVEATLTDVDGTTALVGAQVTFTIVGADAHISPESQNATTVASGNDALASATFTTTAVDVPTTYSVRATATVGDKSLVATSEITLVEQGAIIFTASTDRQQIFSDGTGSDTMRVTVTYQKDGTAIAGSSLAITIDPEYQQELRFIAGSNAVTPETEAAINVDNAELGTGTVQFLVQVRTAPLNELPIPSQVGVVRVVPNDGNADPTDDEAPARVNVEIVRSPIISSFVAKAPEPAVIGTLGAAIGSFSTVSFELTDDRGAPVQGVSVTFAKNATADQGISVVGSDISDATGTVNTVITAGTIAGPVTVIATATQTLAGREIVISTSSPPVAIVEGLPNAQFSFFTCDTGILPAALSTTCHATLADRHSNVVTEQQVQFEAEGMITDTPASTSGDVTFSLGGLSSSGASVPEWSFGDRIPTSAAQLAGFAGAAACFDGSSSTTCDLLDLCNTVTDADFCPLPQSCLATANTAFAFMQSQPLASDPGIPNYIATQRACGYPVSCFGDLIDREGVFDLPGDECTVAAGCMDFTSATPCPQDGLLTLVASTRGEETFSDTDGNRSFDPAIDAPVDLPEPFLDKNDNCVRDDYTSLPRFANTPVLKAIHTEPFSDVDGNDVFGFGAAATPTLTNGVLDSDTELPLVTHAVAPAGASVIVGEPCTPGLIHACAAGGTSGCQELPGGGGLATGCFGGTLDPALGNSFSFTYSFTDARGNCPLQEGEISVSVDGPAQVVGDETATIDETNCGIGAAGVGHRLNPLFPNCLEVPFLGAPSFNFTLINDCANATGPDDAIVTITAGDKKAQFSVFVDCPPT